MHDSFEGGEGVPSPVLSITGLPIAPLEKYLAGMRTHLPKNSQLGVLFGVPYHSHYLDGAKEKVMNGFGDSGSQSTAKSNKY